MVPSYIEKLIETGKLSDRFRNSDMSFSYKGLDWNKDLILIGGPCSIESKQQFSNVANSLAKQSLKFIRGGAYKPCTFPVKEIKENGWKEGVGFDGLKIMENVAKSYDMQTVSEIMDYRLIEIADPYIDIWQVGARNFQNYTLLDELAKSQKPILLKRGPWATIDEIFGAVERIYNGGNEKVAICLRGVVGAPSYRHVFESIRWAPDIMMIPAIKSIINIPVIYDPSHSCGLSKFVEPISLAAIAAGANGIIFETHPEPAKSISDPDQAIDLQQATKLIKKCRHLFSTLRNV